MPLRIGLVLYPMVPIALALLQRGPISKFYRAGAVSPQTARRPSSVDAHGDLQSAIRSGVLIETGDGRFYVHVREYRRRKGIINVVILASTLLCIAGFIWAWAPW